VDDFNLSGNEPLRTLSTIDSGLPLGCVVTHDEFVADVDGGAWCIRLSVLDMRWELEGPHFSIANTDRFKIYIQMYNKYKSRLVICADVSKRTR